jgi:uncharacterized protein (DUF58 family)
MVSPSTTPERIKAILKKVRQIEIRTNRMVTDAMAGAYHSVFKGRGMDFEEVREYAIGDDVRSIDWNVTAKMDRPFIKKFREERELTIMLLVDLSASGLFGSHEQSKRELAAELASVLAFSATKNNDKVGLILFTDTVEKFIVPRKGRSHVLRVVRDILFHEPRQRGTHLISALDHLNRVAKRRAVAFVISDFLQGPDGSLPEPGNAAGDALFKMLRLTAQRHDLIAVHLHDPRESELPDVGLITLEDAETGELVEINTHHSAIRERYLKENTRRLEALHRGFRQSGIDCLSVSSEESYLLPLRLFFQNRLRRQ